MDWATIGLSALGGVLSGGVTALALSFVLGRKYQKIEDRLAALEQKDGEHDKKLDKLDTDYDTMTKENNESWQYINRSLGQIEGMLRGLPPPLPPARKSRPGT